MSHSLTDLDELNTSSNTHIDEIITQRYSRRHHTASPAINNSSGSTSTDR